MNSIPLKSFHFMRHGETDWNVRKVYMGSADIPLNENGRNQAASSTKYLSSENIDYIVSSPQLRALETASIVSAAINKPISILDNFRECHWGTKEGQPIDNHEVLFDQWLKGHSHHGAEKIQDFDARVKQALIEVLDIPGNVLIVSHSGVYRSIQRILSFNISALKNCAIFYHKPQVQNDTFSWIVQDLTKE